MKLWILSDLHRDWGKSQIDIPSEAEVAVVAGDVCDDELLMRLGETLPTVFVVGNHEYYGHEYRERLEYLRNLPPSQLYVLENDELVLGDIRFLGCTLWTDYDRGNPIAMNQARRFMNDHRKISWQKKPAWFRFRPEEARNLHLQSKKWLAERFSSPFSGKTVVITHHAPSSGSVAPKYAGQTLNHAYYSDLEPEIEEWQPDIWVHGHTHVGFDYMIGKTRVLCNPHGYPGECPEFNPHLVVEV